MIVRLHEIDDVLEARIEQFGGEDEPDRRGEHEPMRRVEMEERAEGYRDDREDDLRAEIRLVDERLPDAVDRVRDGVCERPLSDGRPPP